MSQSQREMKQAVIFDLDGTLLDRHSCLLVYIHQQLERCADLLGHLSPTDYLTRVVELDAHGHTTKDVVFRQIEADFNLPTGSWPRLFDDFQDHFTDICVPLARMHQTLALLADKGFALGLITNGRNASQNPKIDGLGIRPYFGALLVSEAEGIRKPDPEIFQRALTQLKVRAENAVFVGDNPEADIQGAKGVGMKAVWMQDAYWPRPDNADATITQLDELPGLLDRIGLPRNRTARS